MIVLLPKARPYRVTRFIECTSVTTGEKWVVPVITGVRTGSPPGKYEREPLKAGFWGRVAGWIREHSD